MEKNKKALCWLSFAHGITDIYSGFLTPLMPFIAAKIGFSLSIATILISLSHVISSIIQPLFGYFADISSKRFFIFWGLILGSISNPIAANVDNFWLLCIFIILGTLGGGMFHPQAMGLVLKFSDKNTVYKMSVFVTMGTLGFAFGPLISSYVAQTFGYNKLLYLSVIGLITAILMFKFIPKTHQNKNQIQNKNFFIAIKDILSNHIMLILIIMGLMKTLIQSSCSIMMPFLWKDLGYSPIYIGFGMFLFLFAGGIGSLISHWFEEKFGAKFVFYASMTITFPLMIIYSLTYKAYPLLSLIIFVFIGFLAAFAQPITLVMAQKTLPEYRSIVSGIINGFTWGLVAMLLIALGFVAEKIGIIKILIALSILPVISSTLVKHLPDRV